MAKLLVGSVHLDLSYSPILVEPGFRESSIR